MRLQSTSQRKAKTSHLPNPSSVGPSSVDKPFEVKGYMKSGGKGGKKKGAMGKKRAAKKHSK